MKNKIKFLNEKNKMEKHEEEKQEIIDMMKTMNYKILMIITKQNFYTIESIFHIDTGKKTLKLIITTDL